MSKFVDYLTKESDRGAALLAGADLDVALEEILTGHFDKELNAEDVNLIFGESGPLVAFASKIRIAYAMGFYGPVTRDDLLLIARIRNVFAHSAKNIAFDNTLIEGNCKHMRSLQEYSKSGITDWDQGAIHLLDPRKLFVYTTIIIGAKIWRVAMERIRIRK